MVRTRACWLSRCSLASAGSLIASPVNPHRGGGRTNTLATRSSTHLADLQVSLNSFCDLYKAVDCSPRQPERRNKTRVDGERTSDRRVADALALYQG